MTPHPDADAFLRCILENPEDDAPRLTFADWLEEHGEGERAEFIRVQCEIAQTPEPEEKLVPGYTSPALRHMDALRRRERELLERSYAGEIYLGIGGGPWTDIKWSRGFVDSIACTAAEFLGGPCYYTPGAVEVFKSQPVTKVVLTDREPREEAGEFVWEWHPDRFAPHFLQSQFFDLLQQGRGLTILRSYPTRNAALAALSAACVAFGRVHSNGEIHYAVTGTVTTTPHRR